MVLHLLRLESVAAAEDVMEGGLDLMAPLFMTGWYWLVSQGLQGIHLGSAFLLRLGVLQ